MVRRERVSTTPEQGVSRRGFGKLVGAMALTTLLSADRPLKSPVNLESFERGFSPITKAELDHLKQEYILSERSLHTEPLPIDNENNKILSASSFEVVTDEPTIHRIQTTPVDPQKGPSLHMARVFVDQGTFHERSYVMPIIRTEKGGSGEVMLSGLGKGKHTITISQDPNNPIHKKYQESESIRSEIMYDARIPDTTTVLGAIYAHTPLLAIRPDVVNTPQINAPVFRVLEIKVNRATNTYLFTTVDVFRNENGGDSPAKRWAIYHRLVDVAWSYKAMLHNGKILNNASELYQGFYGAYPFRGNHNGDQAIVQIETLHNTFDDAQTTNLLCWLPIVFSPYGMSTDAFIASRNELEALAAQEIQNNGKMTNALRKALEMIK